MRLATLALVVLAPLAAAGDVSIGATASERCLATVERALAADFAGDGREGRYCERRPDALDCRGECDSWSCHTDLCDGWATSIDVELAVADAIGPATRWTRTIESRGFEVRRRRVGGLDARVTIAWSERDDFAPERVAELRAQAARARRVLDACLAQ